MFSILGDIVWLFGRLLSFANIVGEAFGLIVAKLGDRGKWVALIFIALFAAAALYALVSLP